MKRIISALLVSTLVITSTLTSFASSPKPSLQFSSKAFEKFADYIVDLPDNNLAFPKAISEEHRSVTYKFFDENGNDITAKFISNISGKSLKEQYNLFTQEVSHATKCIETIARAGDLTKTVEKEIYHNCNAITIEGANWDQVPASALKGRVYYRLRGAVTYNPNSYKITSTTPALRVSIDWLDWNAETRPFTKNELSPSHQVSSDGYSATFDHSVQIFANHGANDMDYVLLGYGTFKDSFRISVN